MRTFTIILFIFFAFFLIISLFVIDPFPFFLVIFLAFLIAFICLAAYLGSFRGILAGLLFIFLPFILESLHYHYHLPFSSLPLIRNFTFNRNNLPITLTNLFTIITIPLLFLSSLFFAQKIKILANVKNYHKTFLILASSFLMAISFLAVKPNNIDYNNFVKWLIIALITNLIVVWFYKFKPKTPEIYKESPIILYLAIYGMSALKRMDAFNLIITVLLTFLYLILLYNEYKIRKIGQTFKL